MRGLAITTAIYSTCSFGQRCETIPAKEPDAPIEICESLASYSVRVYDTHYSWTKEQFISQASETLHDWVQTSLDDPDSNFLCGAQVEYWMSVPEMDPGAAQPRLVISTARERFVARIPLRMAPWSISNQDVSILDNSWYPQSYGYVAGSVLVKILPEHLEEAIQQLEPHGARYLNQISSNWYHFAVNPFQETELIERLKNSTGPNNAIESLSTNGTMEWIADHGRGFTFTLPCD